jgi:hypothetical protein
MGSARQLTTFGQKARPIARIDSGLAGVKMFGAAHRYHAAGRCAALTAMPRDARVGPC